MNLIEINTLEKKEEKIKIKKKVILLITFIVLKFPELKELFAAECSCQLMILKNGF